MKKTERFVGECSKFVSGEGWVTEIPVSQLHDKGYHKMPETAEKILAKLLLLFGEDKHDTVTISRWEIEELFEEQFEVKIGGTK